MPQRLGFSRGRLRRARERDLRCRRRSADADELNRPRWSSGSRGRLGIQGREPLLGRGSVGPDATDSSASTDMGPDQQRHHFGHPQADTPPTFNTCTDILNMYIQHLHRYPQHVHSTPAQISSTCTFNTCTDILNMYIQHLHRYPQHVHSTPAQISSTCTFNTCTDILNMYIQHLHRYPQHVHSTPAQISSTCTFNTCTDILNMYIQHLHRYPQHVHSTPAQISSTCTFNTCTDILNMYIQHLHRYPRHVRVPDTDGHWRTAGPPQQQTSSCGEPAGWALSRASGICPVADSRTARSWPTELPGGGLRGRSPAPTGRGSGPPVPLHASTRRKSSAGQASSRSYPTEASPSDRSASSWAASTNEWQAATASGHARSRSVISRIRVS